MAAFMLRTRCIVAHPLKWARPSNYVSSFHVHAGTPKHQNLNILPRRNHAQTTGMPSISTRRFGLTSNLFAVDPLRKGSDYAKVLKNPVGIKILPSKPHHAYQENEQEISNIERMFDKLFGDNGVNGVVGVYIRGSPASGKTQLAREFGERYYRTLTDARNIGEESGNKAVVATLYTRTPASFIRSYFRLAENLGLPVNRYNVRGNIRDRILLISVDVQKALAEMASNWLLILDGIDPGFFRRFHPYLPHPGNNDWGQGRILVTTRYDAIIPINNNFVMPYTMTPMSEANAVSLLHKVSGYEGDGAEAVVNSHYVGKMPLDVASTGIIIKNARKRDSAFTYATYKEKMKEISESLEKDAQKNSIASGEYPFSAVAYAARELASDEWLKTVFTILALCAHEPLPMSTFKRFLDVAESDDDPRIQAIKDCDLLTTIPEQGNPIDNHDAVETVYLYKHTYKALRSLLKEDHDSDVQQEVVKKRFADCLVRECENATTTHSHDAQWKRQLLLPHLETFHKDFSFDQNQKFQLSIALSNAYTDVIRDPKRAFKVLEKLQAELKEKETDPHHVAKLNLGLWKLYRHLEQYEQSTTSLMTALNERSCLEEKEVENTLKELSATVSDSEEYIQNRNQLEETLQVYEALGSKPPIVAEAFCSLAYLSIKLKEWDKEEDYLEKTLHELKSISSEDTPFSPSMHTAVKNLAIAYMEIGEREKSIKLLQCMTTERQDFSQQDTAPLTKLPQDIRLQWRETANRFIHLANVCMKMEEEGKDEDLESALLDQNHSTLPAVEKWAIAHTKAGEYDKSLKLLQHKKQDSQNEREPLYDNDTHRNEIFQKHDPIHLARTDSDKHQALKQFAQEVEIVIQSCNTNEYYASLELMKAPNTTKSDGLFGRAVQFPNKDEMKIALGVFAGYKAAIAWTEQGASCEDDVRKVLSWFPNTKALLGVGVAYGMDRDAHKVCDVLVATQIADLGDRPRFQGDGIYPRGDVIGTRATLRNIFCKDDTGWHFQCTKGGRAAKVIVGQLASGPFLLDDADFKQKIQEQFKFAKGGEMEGWALYTRIMRNYPDLEVIIIKGVADYADGEKDKQWQLTAAMAAADYTHFQLQRSTAFYGESIARTPKLYREDI